MPKYTAGWISGQLISEQTVQLSTSFHKFSLTGFVSAVGTFLDWYIPPVPFWAYRGAELWFVELGRDWILGSNFKLIWITCIKMKLIVNLNFGKSIVKFYDVSRSSEITETGNRNPDWSGACPEKHVPILSGTHPDHLSRTTKS